jgi:hypothetical protein
VYRRALLLTAATAALLSGPAFGAATTISKSTSTALTTSASGPITIDDGGTVEIASNSSTAATTPAITINSTTQANNIFTALAGSTLSYNGTADAIVIQANPNVTGEILGSGAVNATGSGTDKNAIVFGDPTLVTSGTFTGVADSTNNSGRVTALALLSGSTVSVVGDGSSDIEVVTGNTVTGDIVVGGTMTDEATSLTATTNTSVVTAVNMSGTLNGIFSVAPGGTITSTGGGAEGVLVLGQVNGAITNFGAISAVGSTTLSKTTGNPEAGSALIISNNVTGGIYNAGPDNADTTTVAAILNGVSNQPVVDITPGFDSTTLAPLTIGGYTDPAGIYGAVSFLNRGRITAAPSNDDDASTAVAISGVSATYPTTLTNGIVNANSISASVTTDTHSTLSGSAAIAVSIGNYVTLGGNTGTVGNGDAFVNAGDYNTATISATVSGEGPGSAAAIIIGSSASAGGSTGTSVPSLYNTGTITATATTSDPTIAGISAYGILDNSGTLTNITNSGIISAFSGAVETVGTSTSIQPLNNFANVAEAINVKAANSGVTIMDSGTIIGDIALGEHADTINVAGTVSQSASIQSNIFFGGDIDTTGNDTLNVGSNAKVTGNVLEQLGSVVNVNVASAGTLDITNNGSTVDNAALPSTISPSLAVGQLTVANGGTLGLTVAQGYNENATTTVVPVVQASQINGSSGTIDLAIGSTLNLSYGSFVSISNVGQSANTAQFVLFDAPNGHLVIGDPTIINNDIVSGIPFLFNGSVCGYNTGFAACGGTNPEGTHSDLVLSLTPKAAGLNTSGLPDATHLGLTGYAAKMFPLANIALANDSTLGAAVITAGNGLAAGSQIYTQGQKLYQGIYDSFAPDVTGASRAVAISITDQATGPVGARQRELRMYSGLDGDATLWGQEFGQRLNVSNTATTTGYANTGWGFALGMDEGNPHDGRYGGAFTFFSGSTSEKAPRTSKTQSDWFMMTGYTDWRNHGFFFDSQLSAGYGQLTGKRSIVVNDAIADCNNNVTCTAEGKRGAAMLAGGVTTGMIYHAGGTVFIPQISLDGLTMREDGYTESTPNIITQATSGFDLHVKPYYADSLRAFAGADLRQDLKFGDYFVQPELRAGFRYDFVDGAQKLKAEFACSAVANGACGPTSFSITGPDPSKGNLVLGGGLATTTGAWSIGINYDYLRGELGGTKGVDQVATFTLIGRI